MKKLHTALLLLLSVFPLFTLAHQTMASNMIEITGEIGFRERIALRPGQTATVTLNDISVQDTAAPVIVETSFPINSVPTAFELKTASSHLLANHRYSVRATIRDQSGALRWTTDTVYPIDPEATTTDLGMLVLKQVAATPANMDSGALIGGEWLVEDINNRGVMDYAQTTLSFDTDGRVFGSGGCNRYNGSYQLHQDKLEFGPIAATKKACTQSVSHQEQLFFQLLDTPLSVAFDETGALVLTGEPGQSLKARRK